MDIKESFYKLMEIENIEEFCIEFDNYIEKLERSEIKESLYLASTFRNTKMYSSSNKK